MCFREALEAKSKLYDKLLKGGTDLTEEEQEYCRRYLVKFDKKAQVSAYYYEEEEEEYISENYDPPKNRDEEWYLSKYLNDFFLKISVLG